jgi:hypothetical protein
MSPGQPGHRVVQRHAESEVRADGARPVLQVGTAQIEPAFQRDRVRVLGTGLAHRECGGRRVERDLGDGHTGSPGQVPRDGLTRAPLRLLRQVADRGRGRVERDRAALRIMQPGEGPQQRGLARTVSPGGPTGACGRLPATPSSLAGHGRPGSGRRPGALEGAAVALDVLAGR